jgi:hypothetical protein
MVGLFARSVLEAIGVNMRREQFIEHVGLSLQHRSRVCMKVDFFEVSPKYQDKDLVEEILKNHGGVMFTADIMLGGEMGPVCR